MDIAAEGLCLSFDRVAALTEVTLHVPNRQRVLLCGEGSSGKTSLLKALAGLLQPCAGRVLWGNDDIWRLTLRERRARRSAMGMVFQTNALFDSMTVMENVLLPLEQRGVAAAAAHDRALALLAQLGLSEAAGLHPEHLSGGMKKRAGLARAIAAEPAVLFADDPLAGLDPATARKTAALLWAASAGRTLVVAAPRPSALLPFDRELTLVAGRLA